MGSTSAIARTTGKMPPRPVLVYFGTRSDGPTKGVTAARFDPGSGTLVALPPTTPSIKPTWLLASPTRATLYAVSETGNDGRTDGHVISFAVDRDTGRLTSAGSIDSGGGGPTFLTFDARDEPSAVLVANYGSGDIGVMPIGPDGVLAPVVSSERDVGRGATPRQASAHPHGLAIDPSGRHVLVADLGADRIFVYGYDPVHHVLAGSPTAVQLPPGSGPRHIVFHPNGRLAFANAELTGDVLAFRWQPGTANLSLERTYKTRAAGYAGELSSAEIVVSADGRFLYVSNRGEDVLLVYAIDRRTGALSLVQRTPSGGKSPVGLAIDPSGNWMIVANEGSNLASIFRRSISSGRLEATGRGLNVDDPTGIALMPVADEGGAR